MSAVVADVDEPRHVPTSPPRRSVRWVPAAALALVVGQLVLRGIVLAGRDYYSDDFILLDLAHRFGLLSPDLLLHDLDGQFMPGGMLVAGLVERAAALEWWPAAVSVLVLQAAASAALLRLLWVLLGNRPALLLPLAVGLYTPITLGSTTWWAAALNSLPLQAGLAWFLADAVRLTRDGIRRCSLTGPLTLALTLCFYLKAILVPGIGFAVVVIVLRATGVGDPLRLAWRRGRALWIGSAGVLAAWVTAYLVVHPGGPPIVTGTDAAGAQVLATVVTALRALAAFALGGPFFWVDVPPGTPVASVPTWMVVLGAAVVLRLVARTVHRQRGAHTVWLLVLGTVVAGTVMAGLGRAGLGLGEVAPLASRYFADTSVVLATAIALLTVLPPRPPAAGEDRAPTGPSGGRLLVGAGVVFVAACVLSTIAYGRAWQEDRTGRYLDSARDALAAASSSPLLDQAVPADVMWSFAAPANRVSRVLGPLPERPAFGAWTDDLRMLDDDGQLVPAHVEPGVQVAGTGAACGSPVGNSWTAVALTADVFAWEWTVQLDYTADQDGTVEVRMGDGDAVQAEVRAGAGSLFVRLTGGGPAVDVVADSSATGLCIASGIVGTAVPS